MSSGRKSAHGDAVEVHAPGIGMGPNDAKGAGDIAQRRGAFVRGNAVLNDKCVDALGVECMGDVLALVICAIGITAAWTS